METMFTRASESTDFGLKSPEKPCKLSKKSVYISLGRRCRRFESCHSDQKRENSPCGCFLFFAWFVGSVLFCVAKCRFAYRRYHVAQRSYPVIPTIKGGLSHGDQTSFSFPVRFQSSMFAVANRILFRLWRMLHSDQKSQIVPYGSI